MLKLMTLFCAVLASSSFAGHWEINHDVVFNKEKIRSGIKRANGKNLGHVLYLQGLGDSMLNHDPLFEKINDAGFSVIAFDYQGQGGSKGSMNDTTIQNINELADIVWSKYLPNKNEKKVLIGWSTGGLASYRYAHLYPEKTKAIIMLAPGIVPRMFVGETRLYPLLLSPAICLIKKEICKILEITEKSLTQNKFENEKNPHVDKIRPNSPLKVPSFSVNLLTTAKKSKKWKISEKVKGLVFLSDDRDSYVKREDTKEVLNKNASHFEIIDYQGTGALHELDNEIPAIAEDLQDNVVNFLREL